MAEEEGKDVQLTIPRGMPMEFVHDEDVSGRKSKDEDASQPLAPKQSRRCAYMQSDRYSELSKRLPRNSQRATLVASLIEATGALSRMYDVSEVCPASDGELAAFHTRAYLHALRRPPSRREDLEDVGLVDDCPPFQDLIELASLEAGGSLQACDMLVHDECDVAIWWGGGRHHAMADKASGYCYVNDCNLAILRLLKRFDRVMYIDIDVHHCDGVEESFGQTDRVLTVSFHHHGHLFFPGTGGLEDGAPGAVNVPLEEGCSDGTFVPLFSEVIAEAHACFRPSCVILQCGADALAGDPVGVFNLTAASYLHALAECMALEVPLLLLGGGGYNPPSVAKLWALLTLRACEGEMPRDVPPHVQYEAYAPDMEMCVKASCRTDRNDARRVKEVREGAVRALRELRARLGGAGGEGKGVVSEEGGEEDEGGVHAVGGAEGQVWKVQEEDGEQRRTELGNEQSRAEVGWVDATEGDKENRKRGREEGHGLDGKGEVQGLGGVSCECERDLSTRGQVMEGWVMSVAGREISGGAGTALGVLTLQ